MVKSIFSFCGFIMVFLSFLLSPEEYPPHQALSEVVRIELLDTSESFLHNDQSDVLRVLDESEYADFWSKLESVEFTPYYSDPSTTYGDWAVRIYYRDGSFDTIGLLGSAYYVSGEGQTQHEAWYYVENEQTFLDLFSCFS